MNQSAMLSTHATSDCRGYEFDYQSDFTQVLFSKHESLILKNLSLILKPLILFQFLEEARKGISHGSSTTANPEMSRNEQLDREKKQNRKSWKTSLLSWLKTDKKGKSTNHYQPTNSTTAPKLKRGHFSGPVRGIVGSRVLRSASGQLGGVFSETGETEVPYMCLAQLDNPQKLHSYGPVYLVT